MFYQCLSTELLKRFLLTMFDEIFRIARSVYEHNLLKKGTISVSIGAFC